MSSSGYALAQRRGRDTVSMAKAPASAPRSALGRGASAGMPQFMRPVSPVQREPETEAEMTPESAVEPDAGFEPTESVLQAEPDGADVEPEAEEDLSLQTAELSDTDAETKSEEKPDGPQAADPAEAEGLARVAGGPPEEPPDESDGVDSWRDLASFPAVHAFDGGDRGGARSDVGSASQMDASGGAPVQLWDCTDYDEPTCVQTQLAGGGAPVQRWDCTDYDEPTCVQSKDAGPTTRGQPTSPAVIHSAARQGLAGASTPLPHFERIQTAFGRHDISTVRTNVGGTAGGANQRMGARAFTSGDRIGFRNPPDLRLAAHEATHVVQQREGLSLPGNVGQPGDRWERHADQVADTVASGRSAEPLLNQVATPGPTGQAPVPLQAQASEADSDAPIEDTATQAVQCQITSMASRIVEPPVGGGGRQQEDEGGGEETAPAEEQPAPETPEGEGETPEEPTPESADEEAGAETEESPAEEEGAASGGATDEGTGGRQGISAPCYGRDPEPPPDDAEEPSGDEQSSDVEEDASTSFPDWEDPPDTCEAGEALNQQEGQIPAEVQQGEGAEAAQEGGGEGGEEGAGGEGGEGGDEAASPEGQSMADAAATEASQSEAVAAAMDGQIATAEGQRDSAVDDYLGATAGIGAAPRRARKLGEGIVFSPSPQDGPDAAERREMAADQIKTFMMGAADQIADAVAFVQEEAPARLGALAESVKANIEGAMEAEKAMISARVEGARTMATGAAEMARAQVLAQYESSVATIQAETDAAISILDGEHEISVERIDQKEETGLEEVNSRFAAGRTAHEAKGPVFAARALARGQEHAHAYQSCKGDYSDDGFWDGCLTVRRARAQQDAACKTAAGYKDTLIRTANQKAYNLQDQRSQFRCAVIAGAQQATETLDDTHEQLVSGLESGRSQALEGLSLAREQNLSSIDDALSSTQDTLEAQERTQRQAINDTGYMKQLAVEQLAHATAAGLAHGVTSAVDTLESVLGDVRKQLIGEQTPDPDTLAASIASFEERLTGGMGTLLEKMEQGAVDGEVGIEETGAAALQALLTITAKNDELAGQVESSFTAQMSSLTTGAGSVLTLLTSNHVQQAQQTAAQGLASMQQIVTGFDQAVESIYGRVDEALRTSLTQLDTELDGIVGRLDAQIPVQAWKAAEKEQPAWKSVVAILLIIIVIIAATIISIVTLGAGASLFAVILVGALVGAVSGGLIQIINNWSTGQAWDEGLVTAMVMGAIGGALGGGLGFAAGAISAAAGPLTQVAVNLGADLLSEGLTQVIGYVAFGQQFNWQGFLMAGGMSGVSSFRSARGGRARGGTADAPSSSPRASGPDGAAPTARGGGPDAPSARADGPDAPSARADGPDAPSARADGPDAPSARADGPDAPSARADGPDAPSARPGVDAPGARSIPPGVRDALNDLAVGFGLAGAGELIGMLFMGEKFDATRFFSSAAAGSAGARAARPRGPRPTDGGPTVRPTDDGPTIRPTDDGPTIRPTDVEPTLRPTDAEPTLRPTDAEPTLRPTDAEPTLRPTDAEPTLRPTDAEPTLRPADADADAPPQTLKDLRDNPSRLELDDGGHALRPLGEPPNVDIWLCSQSCGSVRQKIDDAMADVTPGTEAHDALTSLRAEVERIEAGLGHADPNQRISPADAVHEINGVARQMELLGEQHPSLAAKLVDPTAVTATPRDHPTGDTATEMSQRRGSGDREPLAGDGREWPQGWSGADEARWLGYPEAPEGHHWVSDPNTGRPRLDRMSGGSDATVRMVYDPDAQVFRPEGARRPGDLSGVETQRLFPEDWRSRDDAGALREHADGLDAHEQRFQQRLDEARAAGANADTLGAHQAKLTEVQGERAATQHMLQNHPDLELARGFASGTGYDQVYVRRNPDGTIAEIVIVEAKGPGAGLSTGAAKGDQMSSEWVANTANEMANSPTGSPSSRRLGQDIADALVVGDPPVRGMTITAPDANAPSVNGQPPSPTVRDMGGYN